MNLPELKIKGRICITLQNLSGLNEGVFLREGKRDFYSSLNQSNFRFFSLYLKTRNFSRNYPILEEEELLSNSFHKQYGLRFKRLQAVSKNLCYYTIQSTQMEPSFILEHAKKENINRVIIFTSNHLLRDEKRLLKIMKLNSFLYYREANFYLAQNLYNPTGYMRKEKLETILKGKGKFAYESTFRMIKLELDQELGSNLTKIRYIPDNIPLFKTNEHS